MIVILISMILSTIGIASIDYMLYEDMVEDYNAWVNRNDINNTDVYK